MATAQAGGFVLKLVASLRRAFQFLNVFDYEDQDRGVPLPFWRGNTAVDCHPCLDSVASA